MNDFVTLILIAVISVGIGIAFGSLITNAMNARQKISKLTSELPAGMVETFRMYLDLKTRTVVLEMKGKKYHRPGELDGPARAFLEQQLSALAGWSKPTVMSKPAGEAAGEPEARLPQVIETPVEVHGSAPSPALHLSSASPDDGPKQSLNPLGVFANAFRNDTHKASFASTSIAAQIDEILQEKLAGLPDEKRAIRLMELSGKGMVVMIGLNHYDGVDAVPDPDVKALIRECVREWEQKMDRQD